MRSKRSRVEEIEVTCGTGDGALLNFSDFVYDDGGSNEAPAVWLDINYPEGNPHKCNKTVISFKLLRPDARKLFEELKGWLNENT